VRLRRDHELHDLRIADLHAAFAAEERVHHAPTPLLLTRAGGGRGSGAAPRAPCRCAR
jgi:hypothetical protein